MTFKCLMIPASFKDMWQKQSMYFSYCTFKKTKFIPERSRFWLLGTLCKASEQKCHRKWKSRVPGELTETHPVCIHSALWFTGVQTQCSQYTVLNSEILLFYHILMAGNNSLPVSPALSVFWKLEAGQTELDVCQCIFSIIWSSLHLTAPIISPRFHLGAFLVRGKN